MPLFNPFSLNLRGRLVNFDRPCLMAILNVTPDSFFAESRTFNVEAVTRRVEKMLSEGADIIDIGGCSTRPGFEMVDIEEEWRRVELGLRAVRAISTDIAVSVDTFRAEVARRALSEGADIVNDISAMGIDPELRRVVESAAVPYILTHPAESRVTPEMGGDELAAVVIEDLSREIERLTLAGVADIIIDPGFGFGKTTEQNFDLMQRLDAFSLLARPILVGISRKSMIWRPLGITPEEALNGTTVLNTFALLHGASILRVHDTAEAREAIDLCSRLGYGSSPSCF